MRSNTLFTNLNARSRGNVARINETQKNILQGVFKFYFDDIYALHSNIALKALKAITATSNPIADIALFKQHDIWNTIQEIQNILHHPSPQNRSVNYPYFGEHPNPNMVVFRNSSGRSEIEPKGLLSLSARNDTTATPITKDATVEYINLLINEAIKKCTTEIKKGKNHQSCLQKNTIIKSDKWVICLAKNIQNGTITIYLQGMQKNDELFLDRYQIKQSLGFTYVTAESIVPSEFIAKEYLIQTFNIDDVQGLRLKKSIKEDVTGSTRGIGISSLGLSYSSQKEEFHLNWAISRLSQIHVVVNKDHLMPSSTSFCSIM